MKRRTKATEDPLEGDPQRDRQGTADNCIRKTTGNESFPTPGLISYTFFLGWGGVCFGWSGGCAGLCPRTIFPSQEMYALVISSRSFFRLNSISAILCSRVLCSSGICSFLSELACYREVDSLFAS